MKNPKYSEKHNGTIALGQTKTCTVTNDDNANVPSGTTIQRWVLHDSATFTILAGAPDAGTARVQFRLYRDPDGVLDPDTCTAANQVGTAEEVTITAAGFATTASGFQVTQSVLYVWVASYSGDQYNFPASTACGDELTQIKAKDQGRNDFLP